MPDKSAKLTAFDFDGTLTYKDSFLSFLIDSLGIMKTSFAFARKPSLLAGYLRTQDRGALKAGLLHTLFGPVPRDELAARMNGYATRIGLKLFRPDALRTWQGTDGPRVIVTASPEMLVAPFGAMIGADRVIGTRLGFGDDGRLLPTLDGINCRGEEKMCRLREAFGPDMVLDAAYGDTAGDKEMLTAAKQGFYRVFKEKP